MLFTQIFYFITNKRITGHTKQFLFNNSTFLLCETYLKKYIKLLMKIYFPYQVEEKNMESFNEENIMESSTKTQLVLCCSYSCFYDSLNSLGHGLH